MIETSSVRRSGLLVWITPDGKASIDKSIEIVLQERYPHGNKTINVTSQRRFVNGMEVPEKRIVRFIED